MLETKYIYAVIVGMALVTYFGRELPFLVLGTKQINSKTARWLSFIPVSVMSALVFQEILINKSGGNVSLNISADNLFLWAASATFVVGFIFKNFFITVIFGMACLAGLRYFLG